MKRQGVSRRNFFKTSAAATAAMAFGDISLAAEQGLRRGKFIDPDKKLNVACVGWGGKGKVDLLGVATENIVAMADIDDNPRGGDEVKERLGPERFGKIKIYRDYRQMLIEMDDQIDAVTVSTPDHTHYPAAIMAIEMGKHVFVQKPLAHTVTEVRHLTEAARKHNVSTVMGNQGHANEGTRNMVEWVRGGLIGDVREVHIWTNRPIWPQGIDRPEGSDPIPEGTDWDAFLGVAPLRPYKADTYHPFKWRGWWDFGCGALGDMGCHVMDASFWALDLGAPASIEAISSPVNNETAPSWSIVTYEFPARGSMPPVTLKWYDGGKKPPRPKDLEESRELSKGGQLVIGSKGSIMETGDYCTSPRIIPEAKMQELAKAGKLPEKTIERIPKGDHYQEWVKACKAGTPAGSNFDYAGPLSEYVLLGNCAIRAGEGKLMWDAEKLEFTGNKEASKWLTKEYRNASSWLDKDYHTI